MNNAIELLGQCAELYERGMVNIPVGDYPGMVWADRLQEDIASLLEDVNEDYCDDCGGLLNHCMCDFENDDDDYDENEDYYDEDEDEDEYDTEEFDNEFVADTFRTMNPFERARYLGRIE